MLNSSPSTASQLVFRLPSLTSSAKLARAIYQCLSFPITICLIGPLGVGKTQFCKFLATDFGITQNLLSASFFKAQLYQNHCQKRLLHVDGYHIINPQQMSVLLHEYDQIALTLIEWPQLPLPQSLVQLPIILEFSYQTHHHRQVVIRGPNTFLNCLNQHHDSKPTL